MHVTALHHRPHLLWTAPSVNKHAHQQRPTSPHHHITAAMPPSKTTKHKQQQALAEHFGFPAIIESQRVCAPINSTHVVLFYIMQVYLGTHYAPMKNNTHAPNHNSQDLTSLWAGYGTIQELMVRNANDDSVTPYIVKVVNPPAGSGVAHHRKVHSYQVVGW